MRYAIAFGQRSTVKRGFALVELLVVVTIIGILVALLLPAVQAARESARRTQCANQLKQLALACLNYETAHRHYPPVLAIAVNFDLQAGALNYDLSAESLSVNRRGQRGHSWIVEVLPQMEQQGLADHYDTDFSPMHNIAFNEAFAVVDLPNLYCPSRRRSIETPEHEKMILAVRGAPTTRGRGNDGELRGGTDYGAAIAAGNCFNNTTKAIHIGASCVGTTGLAAGPMTPLRSGVGSSQQRITDGTSNTLLLGELQRIWAQEDDQFFKDGSGNSGFVAGRSHDGWLFGGAATSFGASVSAKLDNLSEQRYSAGGINSRFFEHPGSEHPGGAQFANADASVHFVSENMDPLILMSQATRAGGEVYSESGENDLQAALAALFQADGNPGRPTGGRQ